MTGDFGNKELAQKHTEALEHLEELLAFDLAGGTGQRLLLGLFEGSMTLPVTEAVKSQKILAIAGAEAVQETGLSVRHLGIYPAEINDERSTTASHMLYALHLLAQRLDLPLDTSMLVQEDIFADDLHGDD